MSVTSSDSDNSVDFDPDLPASINDEISLDQSPCVDLTVENTGPADFDIPSTGSSTDRDDFQPDFSIDNSEMFNPQVGILEEIELDLHSYICMNNLDYQLTTATGSVAHCGVDVETQQLIINGKPHVAVVSLQAHVQCGDKTTQYIYYPKGPEKKHRPSFSEFLSAAINKAMDEGTLDEAPSKIYVYAHFIRADMVYFKDFFDFKTEVDSLGGSFASLFKLYGVDLDIVNGKRFKPDPLMLKGSDNERFRSLVQFVDTLQWTPGYGSLASVGEMLGIPKVEIPEPFSIERMSEFHLHDPEGFEEYAFTDAEITCKFGIEMHKFVREQLQLDHLPATLGSGAVSGFLNSLSSFKKLDIDGLDYQTLFGVEFKQEEYWHVKKQRTQKRRVKTFTPANKFHRPFVIDCCAGGRNEGFFVGPTAEGKWVDIDLRGAYTRGLCDIHPIDYENAKESTDVEDYLGHVMGFAYVKFKFPDGTRFPCLPVDAGDQGRIFPLEGECYCGAPEIYLAHELGCEIEIQHGVIYPWKTEQVRIFEPFVQWVRDQRFYHKKNGDKFREQLVKSIGNNCYGKTYQGLVQGKTGFDAKTGLSKKISESPISNPQIAAHTTSLVRAVIGETLSRIPEGKTVTNVTTDGFICDMELAEIDISGPLCKRYQSLCDLLYKGEHMLEEKHAVKQLIGMKTRGQLTAEPYPGKAPVLAKAGYKPPVPKPEHNEHMVQEYLSRHPGKTYKFNTLISMREQWLTESDLVRCEQERLINFEFDFKRRPHQPYMQSVRNTEHIAFDTLPWRNLEEFRQVRAIFDGWRRKHCLKNMEDWAHWEDHLAVKRAYKPGCGIKFQDGEGSDDLLKRVFLRAYGRQEYGLTRTMKQQELADWLTEQGFPTSLDDVKSGSRNRSNLPYQIIPVTPRVVKLMGVLIDQWPELEVDSFVQEGHADDCWQRVIDSL